MAAALSESFHASIIVRQQIQRLDDENRQKLESSSCARTSPELAFQGQPSRTVNGLSLYYQLLLIPSLIGVELIATFCQIFEILRSVGFFFFSQCVID